jgi:hypothetical protein
MWERQRDWGYASGFIAAAGPDLLTDVRLAEGPAHFRALRQVRLLSEGMRLAARRVAVKVSANLAVRRVPSRC